MANEGGWKPVFRRSQGRKGPATRLHTIFVDDIPDLMTPKGMYTMFSNFGIVKDVYIPEKRRKATKTRFGFVRYDCSIAAEIAIQKANGVWCGDRTLKVKRADFERGKDPKYPRAIGQKPVGIPSPARTASGGRSSYAEVLKGGMNGSGSNIRIKAEEYATDWLQMSVVTKIKTHCSFTDLKAECQRRGLKDIQLREGGGRNVFISFKSKEELMHFTHNSGDWLMEWCESIIVWHKGVSLVNERVVWASCFGVPPHLWNVNNFRKIGEACGVVLEMDQNVLTMESLKCGKVRICTTQLERIDKMVILERDDSTYLVRVVEVVDLPFQSMGGGDLSSATNRASRKEDDDVAVGAGSEHACYSTSISMVNETSKVMGTRTSAVANPLPNVNMQTTSLREVEGNGNPAAVIGLMKSLSDGDLLKPNILLEVVLDEAHFDGLSKGPDAGKAAYTQNDSPIEEVGDSEDEISSSADEGEGAQPDGPAWTNHIMTQGKEISRPTAGKETANTAGIQGRLWRKKGKSGAPFRNGFQRGALVRAASMASSSAPSISNEVSKQKKVRKEAEATVQLGIKLGLELTGHEDEVVERIMQMENEDAEKVKDLGVKPGA